MQARVFVIREYNVAGLTEKLFSGSIKIPVVTTECSASLKVADSHVFESLDLCVEVGKLVRTLNEEFESEKLPSAVLDACLTFRVAISPVLCSFTKHFEVLLVLSRHDSVLRIVGFCRSQQCLQREKNCSKSHCCCPIVFQYIQANCPCH